MKTWPTTGLWRHRDFLKLWAAQGVSAVGSRITRTALPILAVLNLGASAEQVAILSALAVAPGVIVGLLFGGRIDRQSKRPLLIGADLVRAGLLLTIPIAAWMGRLGLSHLYIVTAFTGAASALFQIADNAYLPVLIGKDHLVEGNAKLEATEAIAEISGPGLGGLLVQWITAPVAIILDALSFLVSGFVLGMIGRKEELAGPTDQEPTLVRDLRIGLGASLFHPLIQPVFLAEANSAIWGGFFMALYTIYALNTLSMSPGTLGLVISAGGIGALFGAALAGQTSHRLGLGRAMIACMTGSRIAAFLIPLAQGPAWLAIACLLGQQLIGDALLVGYSVLAISLRQSVLPKETLGRSNATFHVAVGILMPLGALLAGLIAAATDIRTALWISALGGLINPLLLCFSPIRRLNHSPLAEPSARLL